MKASLTHKHIYMFLAIVFIAFSFISANVLLFNIFIYKGINLFWFPGTYYNTIR